MVGDRLLVVVRGVIALAAQLRDLARLPVQTGPQLRPTGVGRRSADAAWRRCGRLPGSLGGHDGLSCLG